MQPPRLSKLAAALALAITITTAQASPSSSLAHHNHHHHHPLTTGHPARPAHQPRQTGSAAASYNHSDHNHDHNRGHSDHVSDHKINMQTFSGALGGVGAEAVTATGDADRPYAVGGDTFTDLAGAAGRSCDDQMNGCADVANSDSGGGFSVGDCEAQACEFFFFFVPFFSV